MGGYALHQDTLTYRADGLELKSELFYEPGGDRRPGVLVFPEAFGLGERSIERAKRLAALGYISLACDLHGDSRFIPDISDAMSMLQPLFADPMRTRIRAIASMNALMARPEVDEQRVAAIGFCFPMPLELARSGANLRAAVGFHTGLATNAPATKVGSIPAKILVCIGADDPTIPSSQRAEFESEMRTAGADWQMHLYGRTVHSFTNSEADTLNMPGVLRYSADADGRSWRSMLALLSETLQYQRP